MPVADIKPRMMTGKDKRFYNERQYQNLATMINQVVGKTVLAGQRSVLPASGIRLANPHEVQRYGKARGGLPTPSSVAGLTLPGTVI